MDTSPLNSGNCGSGIRNLRSDSFTNSQQSLPDSLSAPVSDQRRGRTDPLAQAIARIGGEIPEVLHPPRRPEDLDVIRAIGPSQPEMQPRVRRRLIAPAARSPGGPPPPARRDDGPRSHRVAVRGGPLEAENQPVASLGPV